MKYLKVRNWTEYQHYKHRNPPWIRLYNRLLDDYQFACLQDASKLHLIMIWLLASRTDNQIPCDKTWIASKINSTENIDLDCLVSAGFIEIYDDASGVLASCVQSAASEKSRDRVEKRKRRPPIVPQGDGVVAGNEEAQVLKNPASNTKAKPKSEGQSKPPDQFDQFWGLWPKKVSKDAARKAWAKLKPTQALFDQITAAVENQKQCPQWTKDGGQFIPHAATWLNGRKWEDEIELAQGDDDGSGGAEPMGFVPRELEIEDAKVILLTATDEDRQKLTGWIVERLGIDKTEVTENHIIDECARRNHIGPYSKKNAG